MKKIIILMMLFLVSSQFNLQLSAKVPAANRPAFAPEESNLEVYYFHYTRRCATCEAVESETKKALEENFSELMKSGKITFLSINIEEESNQPLIDLYKASGQTLLFVYGDAQTDLTNDAFLNALTKPEKFRKQVKKTVDDLMK